MAAVPPQSSNTSNSGAAKSGLPAYPNRNAPQTGKKPAARSAAANGKKRRSGSAWLTFSALSLTMLWFGTVGFYVIKAGGFTSFLESSGAAAIVAVTGLMLAPTALFWMIFAYIRRAYDIEAAIEPLMRQLSLVTGQSGIAEGRVRRFNDALAEQVSLLKETSIVSTQSATQALTILQNERAELQESQVSFSGNVTSLVSSLRTQTGELERMLDNSNQHMGAMVKQSSDLSDALTSETQQAEARMTEIVSAIANTLDEVERVTGDRLSDIDSTIASLSEREKSLRTEAAMVTADVEGSASSMVEATERFKELANAGRMEADKLLASLNEQTRVIDNRAEAVRSRISDTQGMMSRMADELTAAAMGLANMGEQVGDGISLRVSALNDAAVALDATAGKISGALDTQLGNYGEQQSYISSLYNELLHGLTTQSSELMKSATELADRASETSSKVGDAVGELNRTTSDSLDRYVTISDKAEAQATSVASNFNSAIEQYAGTARQLNNAAAELQTLATRCEDAIITMDTTITERAGMLDQVSERMSSTSTAIKDDAAGLVLTLQQLTDRLETVRAAATSTSDQTVMRLTDIANAAGRNLTGIDALATGTISKLSDMGDEVTRQQNLIAEQVDSIQAVLGGISDSLASRVASVLTQVERSSSNASELVEGFMHKAGLLGPTLEAQANYATNLATHAATAMGDQAQLFGERLSDEKGRWQAMVEDQAKAFGDTYRELQQQMSALREVQSELNRASQEASGRLLQHNTNVVDLESRIVHSSKVQQDQLTMVREEIEKIVDHLQSQASALSTMTQSALENVRGATEEFGEQARTLSEVSRQTEGNIISATTRLGDASILMGETRQSVFGLREEIENTLGRLSAQTAQLSEMRDVSRDSVHALANSTNEATDKLDALAGTLARAVEQASHARTTAYDDLSGISDKVTTDVAGAVRLIEALSQQVTNATAEFSRTGQAVSKDLTGQIESDTQTLRNRLAEVSNDLTAMISGVLNGATAASEQFRTQVSGELSAIEERADVTAMKIAGSVDQIGTASRMVTEQMARAFDQINATDATLTQLGSHASIMRRQMVDESEAMVTTIDNITQQLTSSFGMMRGSGKAAMESTREDANELQEMLQSCLDALGNSSTQLHNVSQTAGTYLNGFGSQLTSQVSLMREAGTELAALCDTAAGSENKIESTLGALMMQVTRARGDLASLDLQIADQTTRLNTQQTEALSSLSQTLSSLELISNRIVGSSQDALNTVTDVQSRYEHIATYADDVVAGRSAALLRAVTDGETALSRYADAAIANTGVVLSQQEQLEDMLSGLRRETAASEERMTNLADKITAAGVATGSSAQAILERLGTVAQTLIKEFSDVTNIAESSTTMLRSQGDALRHEMGSLSATAQSVSTTAGDAIMDLKGKTASVHQDFTADLEAMLGSLSQAQGRYEQMTATLTTQQDTANQMITTIAQNFSLLLQTTQSTMEQMRAEIDTAATATSATLEASGTTLQTQTAGFAGLGERLATVVEQIGYQTSQVLGDLRGVTERLETAQSRTGEMANVTEQRLSEAANMLEARQFALAQGAEQAVATLQQASNMVGAQTTALGQQVEVTEAHVKSIGFMMDELQNRTASLRQQLAGDTDTVSHILRSAVGELEKATGTLVHHGESARSSITSLSDAVGSSADQIIEATTQYKQGQQDMNQAAQSVLSDTARILGDFYSFKSQLGEQVAELTQHVETLTGSTDARVRDMASALAGIVSEMSDTDKLLNGHVEALSGSHSTLRSEVSQSMQAVAAASSQLRQTSSDMYSDIEGLGENLSRFGYSAKTAMNQEVAELRDLIESATGLISELGQQLEIQVTAVTDAGSALAHVSGSVNDNTAAALSRLQTLNQRLEAAKLAASHVTEQAARRVADILAQVDRDEDEITQQAG